MCSLLVFSVGSESFSSSNEEQENTIETIKIPYFRSCIFQVLSCIIRFIHQNLPHPFSSRSGGLRAVDKPLGAASPETFELITEGSRACASVAFCSLGRGLLHARYLGLPCYRAGSRRGGPAMSSTQRAGERSPLWALNERSISSLSH